MDKAKAEWAQRSIPPENKTAGGDGTFSIPLICAKGIVQLEEYME